MSPADRHGLQLVSCHVGERLYGLDIRVVKEINPNVDICRVPQAPREIRGLVNVRGQVVLVIDVSVILGCRRRPITGESHVIILKTAAELSRIASIRDRVDVTRFGEKPTAFLVDRIGDVVRVDSDDIEPTPSHLGKANSRYFDGVVRAGEELQAILNAQELLAWARPCRR